MTLRFASNPVPFAARTITLATGHVLTPQQLAQLLTWHTTGAADVAVVCADRPTLLAITKTFRAALTPARPVAPVAPVRPASAPSLAAQLAEAMATVTQLTATVEVLQARIAEQAAALTLATASATPTKRTPRASKAASPAA